MKRYLVLAFASLALAFTLASCASYGSMSTHGNCQANRANNHNTARGTSY